MTKAEIARLLALNGYQAYMHTLVGGAAPSVEAAFQRMTHPNVGDLVLETSTRLHEGWPGSGIGWLEKVADEPIPDCDDCGTERAWYIRSLVGPGVVRWVNANFISLVDSEDWRTQVEREAYARLDSRV